ncbi:hypothetical protein [Azospirillum sp. B4]|uniref:hypothetical protein n=1 Tax=Azospirillum sp. B4 TaxID=95605 RepID=UPI0005C9C3DE|nr:hypothetical protein [Azospirillum sp. B4]
MSDSGAGPWKQRIKRLDFLGRNLAVLAGITEQNLSRALSGHLKGGVPAELVGLITALEVMAPAQRGHWLARMQAAAGEHPLPGLIVGLAIMDAGQRERWLRATAGHFGISIERGREGLADEGAESRQGSRKGVAGGSPHDQGS